MSFGFDHIISGFCYLIRQKFKLTSFSIACLGVSCTVWSGFWQFFNEGKKRKALFGSSRGEGGRAIYLSPWGHICFPEKIPESNQVTWPWWGPRSGSGRRKTGPSVVRGVERKAGGWVHSHFCTGGPSHSLQLGSNTLLNWTKSTSAGPLQTWNYPGCDLRFMPTGCALTSFSSFFSPSPFIHCRIAWWFTEHRNTHLLHIWITSARGLLLY